MGNTNDNVAAPVAESAAVEGGLIQNCEIDFDARTIKPRSGDLEFRDCVIKRSGILGVNPHPLALTYRGMTLEEHRAAEAAEAAASKRTKRTKQSS